MARRCKGRGRSIQDFFHRLGLHVSASRVKEELARRGIEVSEEQVEWVRIDLLKATDAIRRPHPAIPRPDPRRRLSRPRKVLGRRR